MRGDGQIMIDIPRGPYGKLIGVHGCVITAIREDTQAEIKMVKFPSGDGKLIAKGSTSQVRRAHPQPRRSQVAQQMLM